jgi:hypothetical protein
VNVLLATLEVEGPDTVHVKKGPDAGKEVSVLKMILGDEDGSVCKLTAWREVADAWGALGVKRGDIIYLERTYRIELCIAWADVMGRPGSNVRARQLDRLHSFSVQ